MVLHVFRVRKSCLFIWCHICRLQRSCFSVKYAIVQIKHFSPTNGDLSQCSENVTWLSRISQAVPTYINLNRGKAHTKAACYSTIVSNAVIACMTLQVHEKWRWRHLLTASVSAIVVIVIGFASTRVPDALATFFPSRSWQKKRLQYFKQLHCAVRAGLVCEEESSWLYLSSIVNHETLPW